LGIEHAGTIEKGRDSDRERGQGQPEARASPKKVEKEVKKRRGISHVEMFDVGSPDGHHRDYIISFCDGLACKEHPYLFSFFL